jgi:hypothetical protein
MPYAYTSLFAVIVLAAPNNNSGAIYRKVPDADVVAVAQNEAAP